MENALRACCKGIKIGKILIHREGDNGQQVCPSASMLCYICICRHRQTEPEPNWKTVLQSRTKPVYTKLVRWFGAPCCMFELNIHDVYIISCSLTYVLIKWTANIWKVAKRYLGKACVTVGPYPRHRFVTVLYIHSWLFWSFCILLQL